MHEYKKLSRKILKTLPTESERRITIKKLAKLNPDHLVRELGIKRKRQKGR
jgi:hypothetical protein